MYKYKIGYSTWEESDYVELEHYDKFSKDEITMMIVEAIKELFPKIMTSTKKFEDYFYMNETDKT